MEKINFKGWGYQDFTAGAITGTSVTLTANENGTGITFDSTKVINSSAVIVRAADTETKAYSGITRLFSTKVEVSAHTGASVTLNAIPNATWGNIRIYYYYDYGSMGMPAGYSIAPRSVSANLFNELDNLFITEEELTGGTKTASLTTLTVSGFTTLGTGGPVIKMKKITGTTGNVNTTTSYASGVTGGKILSYTCLITNDSGYFIAPGYPNGSSVHLYYVYIDDSNNFQINIPTAATAVDNCAFKITFIYEE